MKYIISESQVKNLIKKYFKKDLSNNIEMITDYWDLPIEFRRMMSKNAGNHFLNMFGPMFLIKADGKKYLAQDRIEKWLIADESDTSISEEKLMNLLGIDTLGLSMQEFIDAYIDE
jgi:hypothetical protein